MELSLVGGWSRRLAQEIAENTPFPAADIGGEAIVQARSPSGVVSIAEPENATQTTAGSSDWSSFSPPSSSSSLASSRRYRVPCDDEKLQVATSASPMSLLDLRTFWNNVRRAGNSSRPLPYRPPGVLLGPTLRTDRSFFLRCQNPVGLGAAHSMVAAVSGQ